MKWSLKTMIEFDEEKHIYKVDGVVVPGVTEILSPITAVGYSKVNPAVLEHAAMRGTLVHEWCEMYDYGCAEDVMPSELAGYCAAYAAFIRDYRPEWKLSEEIVCDMKSMYAGRLDRYGVIDGVPSVVDIKTIASPTTRNYISVCCQTAAYGHATGNDSANRYALYLKPDGSYRLFDCMEYENKWNFNGLELFFGYYNLYNKIESIGRRK